MKYHAVNSQRHSDKSWTYNKQLLAPGVWRLSSDSTAQDDGVKVLEGEIHLAKDLVPSSAMAHYAIEVCRGFSGTP